MLKHLNISITDVWSDGEILLNLMNMRFLRFLMEFPIFLFLKQSAMFRRKFIPKDIFEKKNKGKEKAISKRGQKENLQRDNN